MSSDLAVRHQSTPPSPASSSTNSLDDQVNNPEARVYFGPIQSPEKILIAEAAHSWTNPTSLPVCLSPRISSPMDSHKLLSLEEDENIVREILEVEKTESPTLAVTIDEDCLQDDIESEPTSALATKISRAHDNPSPPPQQANDDPPLLLPSEHHRFSPSASSSSAISDEPSRRASACPPSPASHESAVRSHNRMQTTSPPTNSSAADLIIFDDSNLPDIPLASPVVKPFPDLLAPTPLRAPAPFVRSAGFTSSSLSFSPRIGSGSPQRPRDDGRMEDHLTLSDVANQSSASKPVIDSPTQLCCPVPSVRSSSPRPISPSAVDPSTTCQPPVDAYSGAPQAMSEPPPPSGRSRELRSLSPTSEGVLHSLLSPTEDLTTIPIDRIPAIVSVSPAIQPSIDWASTPERRSFPEQPSNSVNISDVQRPLPDRSPWRSHIARAGSPNKFTFNNTFSDPNRTPTQKIPIQRSPSPKKDSTPHQSNIFGRPVFTHLTQAERTRSPIRPHPSDAVDRTAVASGISGFVVPERLRSGSEEPISPRRPFPARPSRSASDSEISSPSKSARLPNFSIRPVVARLPDTIPEEHAPGSPTRPAQPSPLRKSGLRQPSSVGSRIPRIGAKPYPRPVEKKQQGKGNEPAPKPAFLARRSTPSNSALPKPVRLVNIKSKSGSEDFASSNPTNIGVPSTSHANPLTPQLSPSLKRKRSLEEMPSPSATQPTFVRRVMPAPKVNQKSSPVPPDPSSESGGPQKKARIGNVRKAGRESISRKRAMHSPGIETPQDEVIGARTYSASPSEAPATPPALPLTSPPPPQSDHDHPTSLDVHAGSTLTTAQLTTSPEPNGNLTNSSVEDPLSNVMYVTRSRRASQPTSDVFGAVRPLQQHRRRATRGSAGGAFSSMSAVTLKALTNTNTAKNQHNLAAILETEVIRKEGNRPGSPGTKVRTIEEKRKLEQGKERRERAERRARRVSDLQEDSSLTSEDEAALPLGPDGQPLRHRRGPGDEEQYESPERERPRTKARIDDTNKSGEENEAKTVRWDRGLFTTIYFDDLPLQSQTRDKSQTPVTHTRGALAKSAKALRLDSLGNVANATSPLKDIVRENVTIKKFVYDDDIEAAVEHEAPKPPSKGKAKKSKG